MYGSARNGVADVKHSVLYLDTGGCHAEIEPFALEVRHFLYGYFGQVFAKAQAVFGITLFGVFDQRPVRYGRSIARFGHAEDFREHVIFHHIFALDGLVPQFGLKAAYVFPAFGSELFFERTVGFMVGFVPVHDIAAHAHAYGAVNVVGKQVVRVAFVYPSAPVQAWFLRVFVVCEVEVEVRRVAENDVYTGVGKYIRNLFAAPFSDRIPAISGKSGILEFGFGLPFLDAISIHP